MSSQRRQLLKLSAALSTAILVLPMAGCASESGQPAPPEGNATTSPLDEFLAVTWGANASPEELDRQLAARERRVDELIAECMHAAGFQYLPRTEEGWGSDPRQLAYIDTLSDAEFEAWWDAYWGPPHERDADGNFLPFDWESEGCQGWAEHIVESELPPRLEAEFPALFEAINLFNETVYSLPEFVELDSEWAYCMATAGFTGLVRPDNILTADVVLTDVDGADFNCQTETNYAERVIAIIFAAENQFIADHRAELEAFRQAAEQTG